MQGIHSEPGQAAVVVLLLPVLVMQHILLKKRGSCHCQLVPRNDNMKEHLVIANWYHEVSA